MNYRILNLDDTGRFWIDYSIPQGWELSTPFDTLEEAESYADYLRANNQMTQSTSVLGIYVKDDHYPQVVYKTTVSWS